MKNSTKLSLKRNIARSEASIRVYQINGNSSGLFAARTALSRYRSALRSAK